jgi:Zn-dependent protease/CBS domain-containing protein
MHGNRATRFTIGGFRVGFDWSVLIVLGLVAWSLASQVLPSGFPGHSPKAYWLAALTASALFLGSLVMHELSHAIAARRLAGVEVEEITFWLFGGIARIRGELPTPRLQLLVAGIGPLTSLALGAVFWGAAVLLANLGAGSLIAGTALWLGVMNGTLALFNLIPGSPLDGGRVLHAILWRLRGDRTRAALTAARVGQGVGAILVGLGVLVFVFAGNGGGLWTSLVGWFVLSAARGEGQIAALRISLGERRVRDVMSTQPAIGPAWFTVEAFLERFAPFHPHVAFPVQDFDGRLSGLVTLDVLRRVPLERRGTLRIGQLALPLERVITVEPDSSAVELAARLAMSRQTLALVLEEGRLVGVVSPTDLSRAIALGQSFPPGRLTGSPEPVARPTTPPPANAPPAPSGPPASSAPSRGGDSPPQASGPPPHGGGKLPQASGPLPQGGGTGSRRRSPHAPEA